MHVRVLRKQTTMINTTDFGLFMMAGGRQKIKTALDFYPKVHLMIKEKKPADETNLGNAILIRSAIDRTIGVCE